MSAVTAFDTHEWLICPVYPEYKVNVLIFFWVYIYIDVALDPTTVK